MFILCCLGIASQIIMSFNLTDYRNQINGIFFFIFISGCLSGFLHSQVTVLFFLYPFILLIFHAVFPPQNIINAPEFRFRCVYYVLNKDSYSYVTIL